jgi:hypothetical protein
MKRDFILYVHNIARFIPVQYLRIAPVILRHRFIYLHFMLICGDINYDDL